MPKAPEGVIFETDWEDSEVCKVDKLVCSCGTNLLEGHTDSITSHEDTVEYPKCGKKYQFVWMGMTLQEVR